MNITPKCETLKVKEENSSESVFDCYKRTWGRPLGRFKALTVEKGEQNHLVGVAEVGVPLNLGEGWF